MSKPCTYYFAPQSPFAYLGHARFVALAQRAGARVALRPCDMGKIFTVSGGVPLAQRAPQRQAYRLAELARWSRYLQLPLTLQPTFFPVSGDAAARLIIAADIAHGADRALALTGAIMQAVWVEQKNIADRQSLQQIAELLEFDGSALLKSSDTPTVATQYQANTDAAIAAGVFGAPWFVVDGDGFWGQDRLDFVERALQTSVAQ